ncbi:G-alpha-domain-containing protein [Sistotremastrum suecicum HHB10207 ss-3]|uniref:G-alpha-domain-containing protein n=1 Tax=Sistotremastrum suecicum HHB10207 ss-3 TaxID=1314776 RepID=A0A166EWN3_9AGAM|nr:G-alpha-domain-containing protein [Sistotremastrum suecicum HHB10207 ss-3]
MHALASSRRPAYPPNPLIRPASLESHDDPLAFVTRPPLHESPQERQARLRAEHDARLHSEAIDAKLSLERDQIRRRKAAGEVKLLLLGQAESGKSTLQKQFQFLYAPHSINNERTSWRAVIFLNIIRSIKVVFDAVFLNLDLREQAHSNQRRPASSTSNISDDVIRLDMINIKARLEPFLQFEDRLASQLIGGIQLSSATPKKGFYVRSGWQWNLPHRSDRSHTDITNLGRPSTTELDEMTEPILGILIECGGEIHTLRTHAFVQRLIQSRKLKLDEWSDYFLVNIRRIATPNYMPTDSDILRARVQTMGISEHQFTVSQNGVGAGSSLPWLLYDVGGSRGQRHTWAPFFEDATAVIFMAPISAFDQYLDEDYRVNRVQDSLELFGQIVENELLRDVHMVLFFNKADILAKKLEQGVEVTRYITSYGTRPNTYHEVCAYFKEHFMKMCTRADKKHAEAKAAKLAGKGYIHSSSSTQIHRPGAMKNASSSKQSNANGKDNINGKKDVNGKEREKDGPKEEYKRALFTHFTSMVDTKSTQKIIVAVHDSLLRESLKHAKLL